MICGRCGYTNLEDARFCVICGSKLEGESLSSLDPPVGDVPCPHCGEKNEAVAAHCRFCGKKMKAVGGEKSPEPTSVTPEEVPAPDELSEMKEMNPEVDSEELRVLFGFDEEPPPTDTVLEATAEALPTESDIEESELVQTEAEAEPEPEAESNATSAPVDPDAAIADLDETEDPTAEIQSDESASTEELSVETEPGEMLELPEVQEVTSDSDEPVEAEMAPLEETASESLEPPDQPDDSTDEERIATPYEHVIANPRNLAEIKAAQLASKEFEPKPAARPRPERKKRARSRSTSISFRIIVLTTLFVCGLSIGLWTSYFFFLA